MKVKDFFKSQAFKCILVLLVIALISGGLLAIMSDVLFVSEQERTARAIKSIYGEEMEYQTVFDSDKDAATDATASDTGFIEKVYFLVDDGNYLIKATGKEGYKAGTVTLWVIVTPQGNISKVSVASYDKQTLMSKFTDDVLRSATDGNVVVSGATFSAKAFNNALAAVRNYADKAILVK